MDFLEFAVSVGALVFLGSILAMGVVWWAYFCSEVVPRWLRDARVRRIARRQADRGSEG